MDESILLQRSEALVIAMVGKDLSEKWWTSVNHAFEGRTPRQMWEENYRRVYNYLMSCGGGEW